jgi:hypothetical protein
MTIHRNPKIVKNWAWAGTALASLLTIALATSALPGCSKSKREKNAPSGERTQFFSNAQPSPSLDGERRAWEGLVDDRPLTSHFERTGTHPDEEPFSVGVVITTRWHDGKIHQRAFAVPPPPDETQPLWAKTLVLRADGVHRRGYLVDGGDDYTATPVQPMVPWPLRANERRDYTVHYANGESATGYVQALRVGFPHPLDGLSSDTCMEMEGTDRHQGSDPEPLRSESTIVHCKGLGRVSSTARLSNGWTISMTLKKIERGIAARWDVPPPRCRKGKCNAVGEKPSK